MNKQQQALRLEAERLIDWSRKNPWPWIERMFGDVPLFEKQRQILESLRDNRATYVKACHASTKTRTAAYATHWFLCSWPLESKVLTTAPTWTQIVDNLWREIRALHAQARRPLGGRMLQSQFDIEPQWFAKGQSSDRGINFQGLHSPNILVIIDEADGIPRDIWEAIDGILTSANSKLLAIGNPLDPTSEFKRRADLAPTRLRERVIQIRAEDTPNIARNEVVYPFLITPQWVADARENYGETSALYIGKVLAEWPEQRTDTLIPLPWLLRARTRAVEPGIRTLGVDVARLGTDRTVRTLLAGSQLMYSRATAKEDTMQTVSRVLQDIELDGPAHVAIDEVGVGAGVLDRLREIKGHTFPIVGVNNGEKASDPEKFVNLGAEMWWKVRQAFERNEPGLACDDMESVDQVISDLNRPTYEYVREAKLKIDKFGMPRGSSERSLSDEERTRRSPDRGDSYVLSYNAASPFLKGGLMTRQPIWYNRPRAGHVNI